MPEELVVGVERPEFEFASCGERRELMSIIESVLSKIAMDHVREGRKELAARC